MTTAIVAVSFDEMSRLAEAVAKSGLFGMKTPEQALALMAIAQAEGQHPALAARDYHIVQGRPVLKSDAMLARFQAAGGRMDMLMYTDERVEATFSHPQGGSVAIEWTTERAKRAGLTSKDVWKSYPRQMLRARVISEGIRTVFPGATQGLLTPEEAADVPSAEAERDVTPPKAPLSLADRVAAVAEQVVPSKVTLSAVLDRLKEAATSDDMNEVAALAKALPPGEQEIVRPLFKTKMHDLKAAAAPAGDVLELE